jgi:hypothetical protein
MLLVGREAQVLGHTIPSLSMVATSLVAGVYDTLQPLLVSDSVGWPNRRRQQEISVRQSYGTGVRIPSYTAVTPNGLR